MKDKQSQGDPFFHARVAPVLRSTSRRAREEVEARIRQALSVTLAPQRDAVRDLQQEIKDNRNWISQGADAMNFGVKLVHYVAQHDLSGDTGSLPFAGRLIAARELARMESEGKISIGSTNVVNLFMEAVKTEPFPRGAVLLTAVGLAEKRKAALKGLPLKAGWFTEEPLGNSETEMRRFERDEMTEYAARLFARMEDKDFELDLYRWLAISGLSILETDSNENESPTIPKSIIRLNPRGVRQADGKWVQMTRICSPNLQRIAAALGVPLQSDYAFGRLENRNLASLLAVPAHEIDASLSTFLRKIGSSTKTPKMGVALDCITYQDTQQSEDLVRRLTSSRGLQERVVEGLLNIGGMELISGVRIVRRVRDWKVEGYMDFSDQQRLVRKAIGLEIASLKRGARVTAFFEHGNRVVETSILSSATEEVRRLRGYRINEADIERHLSNTLELLTLGSEFGRPLIRTENTLLRLARNIALRNLSPDDVKRFPRLRTGELCVETIRRESSDRHDLPEDIVKED